MNSHPSPPVSTVMAVRLEKRPLQIFSLRIPLKKATYSDLTKHFSMHFIQKALPMHKLTVNRWKILIFLLRN